MRFALLLAAFMAAAAVGAQPSTLPPLYPGLSGTDLRDALRRDYTPARTLGYGPARDSLYLYEQEAFGSVCGLYTHFCILLEGGRDPSMSAFEQGINAEHTWPQSRGTAAEPARSDLHLLFPAKATVNSSRGNHPYAEIPDAQTDAWYRENASQSQTPAAFLDEWSERTSSYPGTPYAARFEPREDRSGDVARAIAYTATIYETTVGASGERPFLATMLADLQAWNAQDPPDDRE
ncbi:MAG: endonuclease, partial [Bacteroidota bacterium]